MRFLITFLTALLSIATHAADLEISFPSPVKQEQVDEFSRNLVTLLNRTGDEKFSAVGYTNPFSYLHALQNKPFAIVIDGPHVIGALAQRNLLESIALFDYRDSFMLLVRQDETSIYTLRDLAGIPVCTGGIPDLVTLQLLDRSKNPTREPIIVPVTDPHRKLRYLLGGKCRATALYSDHYFMLDKKDGVERLRIIYQSKTFPVLGVGIGKRLPKPLRRRLRKILLSTEGRDVLHDIGSALTGLEDKPKLSKPYNLKAFAKILNPYLVDNSE